MKIESRLQLLVDMTDAEAEACKRTAEKIVFEGIIDWERPEVKLWMLEFGDDKNRLLLAATALPQRLLISYINHLEVNRDHLR
jgi:hypothetical protein